MAQRYPIKADWLANGEVRERYFDFIYEPIRDENNRVEGIWIVAFDMTETIEIQNKLRISERMASLGQMAASVVHEINAPLTYTVLSIDQISDLADQPREVWQSENFQGLIDQARDGVDRIQDIIKNLKLFSRFDEAQFGPIRVNQAIEDAIRIGHYQIRHKSSLTTSFKSDAMVFGNSQKLSQVILNLLLNSSQAFELEDPARNHIRIAVEDKDQMVEILVEDNGIGIARENLTKIFDPFFTLKPAGIGTGLGLAICQAIITSMKGTILVQSELGQGTSFTIQLPREPGL